jgi:hypothetical protein
MFLKVSRHSGDDFSISFDTPLMLPRVFEILRIHESLRQVKVSSNLSVRHGADRSKFCGDPTKHWDGFGYGGEMVDHSIRLYAIAWRRTLLPSLEATATTEWMGRAVVLQALLRVNFRVGGCCSGRRRAGSRGCHRRGGGAIRGCAGRRRLFVVLGLRYGAVADAGQTTCLEVRVEIAEQAI